MGSDYSISQSLHTCYFQWLRTIFVIETSHLRNFINSDMVSIPGLVGFTVSINVHKDSPFNPIWIK